MRKLPYRTQLGYKPSQSSFEKCTGKSETVRGETMTIKELMARERAGMIAERKNYIYMEVDDANEVSDFNRPLTDLTDLDNLKRYNEMLEGKVRDGKKSLEAARKKSEAELEAKRKEEIKLFAQWKKQQQEKGGDN